MTDNSRFTWAFHEALRLIAIASLIGLVSALAYHFAPERMP